MIKFLNPKIFIATLADVAAITGLLNSAYRGESSKQGWTNEAHLIGGNQRTDEPSLQQVMNDADSIFLKYLNEEQKIIGCVNLQLHSSKIYLGMFSVAPQLQGLGIGKQLLNAAEEYAHSLKCSTIYMSVIDGRDELINWYKRNGYKETGERKEFIEDAVSGNHLQLLSFIYLEKEISTK